MAPFDAIDKTAFARAASSGASAMKMKSYWPVTMKKSFRIKPHDWNSFLAAFQSLAGPTSQANIRRHSLLPPGVIVFGPVRSCQTFGKPLANLLANLSEDRKESEPLVRGDKDPNRRGSMQNI